VGRRRRRRGERDEARTYRVRSVSTPAINVGRSTERARASRSTASVPMIAGSALLLYRHPNRPVALRFYLGLVGCGGVTALVLLVVGALNALALGAVLGPACGLVVLVAFLAVYGRDSGEPERTA
jgi:peptidoglycan/LPS O-acetylase OafA/YrhL